MTVDSGKGRTIPYADVFPGMKALPRPKGLAMSGAKFRIRTHDTIRPVPWCGGKVVALYRRRGASGKWETWGWTCERCDVVEHDPDLDKLWERS